MIPLSSLAKLISKIGRLCRGVILALWIPIPELEQPGSNAIGIKLANGLKNLAIKLDSSP